MFNSRWLILLTLISSSSFAGVSFKQKQLRVESLMKLHLHAPSLAFESYQRELQYEEKELSTENRVKNETQLLAAKIRQQVKYAYDAALKEHLSPELAREEVKNAIEADLALAAPEMQQEILSLALEALNNIEHGISSEEVELANVEVMMLRTVEARKEFLNEEIEPAMGADPIHPKINTSKDSERKAYNSKAELMESLVSERESSRWVSTANQTVKTGEVTRFDGKISVQVKVEFLGATLEAGPVISFKREYSTNAIVLAEGLYPVLLKDGKFDLYKRDAHNKIIMKNGKAQKRYVAFYCDADMRFETDYSGSGGFKYMGIGADATVSKKFERSVNFQSRRIAIPETVNNSIVTVKYLSQICHADFKKARINGQITVAKSLDILMRNVVAGLVFSHPKTNCVQDSQCKNWFNTQVIAAQRSKNTYRCVENSYDKYRFCQVRGLAGQNCPVIEKGKRTSSGEREYACNFGLKCVKYENASNLVNWTWSYSKGKCQK